MKKLKVSSNMSLRETILAKRRKIRSLSLTGMAVVDMAKQVGIESDYDFFPLFNKTGSKAVHVVEAGPSFPDTATCCNELIRQSWHDYLCKKYPDSYATAAGYLPGRFSLIDPRQEVCEALSLLWGHLENVTIYQAALADYDGAVDINFAGGSSYVDGITSPCEMNDNKSAVIGKFEAKCGKFSVIDDGTVDVLIADVEGSEWFVLKHMHSRPCIIQLETHSLDPSSPEQEYINPYIDEIDEWMRTNQYVRYKMLYGDTIFLREDFNNAVLKATT